LRDGSVKLELEGETKEAVLRELVDLLFAEGKIRDRDSVLRAVLERERQMSTGMQYGVAIPHGKTDAVDGIVTAVALKRDGVDFRSLDGKPSKIFIMTISSTLRAGPHIEFLAEISRVLMRPSVRKRLLKAQSQEEILGILSDD
jgi:PTS system nitrogen regulatory IIA component